MKRITVVHRVTAPIAMFAMFFCLGNLLPIGSGDGFTATAHAQ